jgi:carboxymethylenebutenolidase
MPDITIQARDGGTFSAYLAEPASGKGAGVLVIQEIFGVNAVMRGLTDAFAAQGYFALCPDIFWRQEPGIQITDQTDEEWARAFELFQGFDQDKGLDDLEATMAHLRRLPGCTGKVGSIGYCLGGRMVYLMAARSDVDCGVSYYGVGLENNLQDATAITNPTMLHMAELDKFVPPEAQAKIRDGLAPHSHITVHTYAGVDHAFARTHGQTYDEAASDLANQRTAAFLREHLA